MAGKWVGVFALAAVVGFVSYYETSSLQMQSQVLTAQAAGSTSDTDPKAANKQCPAVTPTTEYDLKRPYGARRVGDCIVPPTPASVQTGAAALAATCIITNLYKKPCFDLKAKLYTEGHCVAEDTCHGDRYMDQEGVMHDVVEPESSQTPYKVASGEGIPSPPKPGEVSPVVNTSPEIPAPPMRNDVAPAFPDADKGGAIQLSANSYKRDSATLESIRAEGARTGAAPGQQTFPSQTQAQVAPGGAAFEQGGFYRAGGTNPSGNLAGSNPSVITHPVTMAPGCVDRTRLGVRAPQAPAAAREWQARSFQDLLRSSADCSPCRPTLL